MEKSTPIGLIAGLVMIYGAVFMGTGWQLFFDAASLILVLGGTVSALLVGFSLDEVKQIPREVKAFFFFKPPDLYGYVQQFTEFSRAARREGLLVLDRRLNEVEDEFMRFGLEMAVDGIEEDALDRLMMQRLKEEVKQRRLVAKFFTSAGAYAPAFGMLGTLIGLIQMMQNLTDPSQIGAGMAVALITTFYGALFANLIFLPMANKMKAQVGVVLKAREMIRTGVLSIVQGDGPSMIEKRLRLYLGDDAADAEPELAKAA